MLVRAYHTAPRSELSADCLPFPTRVLVPANDLATLNPLCSCETYRRPVLLPSGRHVVGYSVAGVLSPPENRKKGYALLMMRLLALELRAPAGAARVEWIDGQGPWTGGNDALLCVLYSDVGKFYQPAGWEIVGTARTTTWALDALASPPSTSDSTSPPQKLFRIPFDNSALTALASADVALLSTSLPSNSFAMDPNGATYHWHMTRSIFTATHSNISVPSTWGFRSTTSSAFVLFAFDFPHKELKILRIRTTGGEEAREMMARVFEEAIRAGCERVVAWNLEAELLGAMPDGQRGTTAERDDSLSALNWFGEEGQGIWAYNEGYGWC